MEIKREAAELLAKIKEYRPLIHHITNYVTMNDSANAVLAIGGSPIMAKDPSEVEEVAAMSKALVLNMGTPDNNNFRSMLLAGKKAKEIRIPVIFDPVGAGVTSFRREMCYKILSDIKPDVIRGNISEIMYLAGKELCSCGVDSNWDIDNAAGIVQGLAKDLNCVVAATGRMDLVSDGSTIYIIENGHEMLSKITGAGCMTSSLVGTFCSMTESCLAGAVGGTMTMGISGQLANACLMPNEGIGMFKVRLFDSMYNLNKDIFMKEGVVYAG
ncbi:MAG TPA: hydroxyethylthiazole kinase [Bacillota bacterium]|nr:hydroxyethylthiazole kinase [Bacillota bacterium]